MNGKKESLDQKGMGSEMQRIAEPRWSIFVSPKQIVVVVYDAKGRRDHDFERKDLWERRVAAMGRQVWRTGLAYGWRTGDGLAALVRTGHSALVHRTHPERAGQRARRQNGGEGNDQQRSDSQLHTLFLTSRDQFGRNFVFSHEFDLMDAFSTDADRPAPPSRRY